MHCDTCNEGFNAMERRTLGNSGLEIAPLIFGGNVFGWTVDEPGAFGLLDAFLASGFNCVDTADSYSTWVPGNRGGESETIIGKWMKLRGNRASVVIATKVGSEIDREKKGLSKSYILRAAEDSLRRLQTRHLRRVTGKGIRGTRQCSPITISSNGRGMRKTWSLFASLRNSL